jgi:ribosome-associated protein
MTKLINTEYQEIIDNSDWEFPLNHAMCVARILADFKADNLKIFDMTQGGVLCDYNILATVQNTTQAKAVADEIARVLKQSGAKIISYEGYQNADWILLDTGDIIAHIFLDSTREVYDLDHVFGARPQVTIPEEFYFGKATSTVKNDNQLKGYF